MSSPVTINGIEAEFAAAVAAIAGGAQYVRARAARCSIRQVPSGLDCAGEAPAPENVPPPGPTISSIEHHHGAGERGAVGGGDGAG